MGEMLYFRNMFLEAEEGTILVNSLKKGQEDTFVMVALGGKAVSKFSWEDRKIDLLVILNKEEATMQEMKAVLSKALVKEIVLPEGIDHSPQGHVLSKNEMYYKKQSDWEIRIQNFGDQTMGVLSGPVKGENKFDDCVLMVKGFSKEQHCSLCADGEECCTMECYLKNDYQVCRRQSNAEKSYVLGTLATGFASGKDSGLEQAAKQMTQLTQDMPVRFLAGEADARILAAISKAGSNTQFVIIPEQVNWSQEAFTTLFHIDRELQFLRTGNHRGICASGFLKYMEI